MNKHQLASFCAWVLALFIMQAALLVKFIRKKPGLCHFLPENSNRTRLFQWKSIVFRVPGWPGLFLFDRVPVAQTYFNRFVPGINQGFKTVHIT